MQTRWHRGKNTVLAAAKRHLNLRGEGATLAVVTDALVAKYGVIPDVFGCAEPPKGKNTRWKYLFDWFEKHCPRAFPVERPKKYRAKQPRLKSAAKHSPQPATPPGAIDPASQEFLSTYEWRRLRMVVLKKHGAKCQCCGSSAKDGVKIHVDHIKPRRLHPELALVEDNLQVLCEVCNHGKGNWDTTDWRQIS